jgi:hypothetical protein
MSSSSNSAFLPLRSFSRCRCSAPTAAATWRGRGGGRLSERRGGKDPGGGLGRHGCRARARRRPHLRGVQRRGAGVLLARRRSGSLGRRRLHSEPSGDCLGAPLRGAASKKGRGRLGLVQAGCCGRVIYIATCGAR